MKRHAMWIGPVMFIAWVVAVPATAQDRAGASPPASSGGGSSASAPASSGGGSSSSGGGGIDRASVGGGSFSGGGRDRSESGGYGGATGGSGTAMPRADYHRGDSGRSSSGASGRTEYGATVGSRSRDDDQTGVPRFSRPRDGAEQIGTAVPRPEGSKPTVGGGGGNYVVVPGGYYSGYNYYPGFYGGFYSGYYDPFYDPWYGGYYSPYSYGGYSQSYSYGFDEGSLRLKIKPRNAEVYVDGYYVGIVDEFDGVFQRLHIESGVHRIEVRAPGYETLTFEVKITPEHKTTYQGELKRIQ